MEINQEEKAKSRLDLPVIMLRILGWVMVLASAYFVFFVSGWIALLLYIAGAFLTSVERESPFV